MRHRTFVFVCLLIILAACAHKHEETDHEEHHLESIKYTAYSAEYELFAEADPFISGQSSNVLSHFSNLPEFTAVEEGSITIRLLAAGKESSQKLDKPSRKGIYSFDITAESAGPAKLLFDISNEKGNFQVIVPEVTVYANIHEAEEALGQITSPGTNTTVFTKEQSWKVDFATEVPVPEPFGQVIRTTAMVLPAKTDEIIVSAKTNGILLWADAGVIEGGSVTEGQNLFSVNGSGLANDNSAVRFMEARNNLEKAKSDYERAEKLIRDKIISEKDFMSAKNQYDNANLIFDNLNKNFSAAGQIVRAPLSGNIRSIFVQNGQYVEPGEVLLTLSKNKTLLLRADVPQKYAPILGTINTANLHSQSYNSIYTLEQLNGKILSYGKSANTDNYLIPVNIQIDNHIDFTQGMFIEVYLKCLNNTHALTLPNTALLEDQGLYFVFVQHTPELFEKREVRCGVNDGLKTEITKGINPGERIVIRGAIHIKLAEATGTLDAHSGHVH